MTEGRGHSPLPSPRIDAEWDAGDLACGDLVLQLRGRMEPMRPGQVLRLVALDSGAPEDLPAWCRLTGTLSWPLTTPST